MSGPEAAVEGAPAKAARRRPLPRDYHRVLILMAREHRRLFKHLFLSDPTLKDRGARLYRSLLLPRRAGQAGQHWPT